MVGAQHCQVLNLLREGTEHTALGDARAQGEGRGCVLAQSDSPGSVDEKAWLHMEAVSPNTWTLSTSLLGMMY